MKETHNLPVISFNSNRFKEINEWHNDGEIKSNSSVNVKNVKCENNCRIN